MTAGEESDGGPARRRTVAVIGGGFSGLLTALHLLDAPDGPRVHLIERRPAFARGAAYSTTSAEHLLNVRAANMSAYPDRPAHFVDWLKSRSDVEGGGGSGDGSTFVTRARYGAYLQALLRSAAETGEAGRLILEPDDAVTLERDAGGWTVGLAMGRSFHVDAAVLAVGNLPPRAPGGIEAAVAAHPAYFGDPWAADFSELPETGQVVILGVGLTMVDLALRLSTERPGLRMLALSRRGLPPRRHRGQPTTATAVDDAPDETARALLRRLRDGAKSGDWRPLVDGLRPHVQAIWRGWSLEERKRFLRHLRPWWDIHRHRIAPAVASRLDHLTGSGALSLAAGRLADVRIEGERLNVAWTPRGRRETKRLDAVALINCTGPNGDLTRLGDPLLAGLAESGAIRPDTLHLGLDVEDDGRLIGRDGSAAEDLYAVGPITRGAFWEITSVPDIRVQTAACARALLARADAGGPSRPGASVPADARASR